VKITKSITLTAVAGLVLALSAGTLKGASDRGQLSERDHRFVKEAAAGGEEEVQLGELASQKGTSPSVRNFGNQMVKDHQQANAELKSIAAKKGAVLPAELSHEQRSTMNHLEKLSGADFDKHYASAMVKDHKKDVKEFKDAAEDLKDPELKAFAQKTTPTLEEHLRLAEEMDNTVKK